MKLQIEFEPGPATDESAKDRIFYDGDKYLMVVRCCYSEERKKRLTHPHSEREWWDYCVVTANCDSETPLTFEGDDWGWDWGDVSWFAQLDHLDLPYVDIDKTHTPT